MLLTCGIMPYSRPNSFPSFGLRTKNAVDVGEFNEYLREHDDVEQFVSISGIAIEEEKNIQVLHSLQENCSISPSYCIVRVIKIACKTFKCNDRCAIKEERCLNPSPKFLSSFHSLLTGKVTISGIFCGPIWGSFAVWEDFGRGSRSDQRH